MTSKLEFSWNLDADTWEHLKANHKPTIEIGDDGDRVFYGSVCVGNLSFDIVQDFIIGEEIPDLFADVYCLGTDEGYAHTRKGNIPYDLVDCLTCLKAYDSYEEFKAGTEHAIAQFLDNDVYLMLQALKPLGNWE